VPSCKGIYWRNNCTLITNGKLSSFFQSSSGLGPCYGKKVTWIGANGDQTFIKIDESLITAQMLPKMHVVANKKTIRKCTIAQSMGNQS